MTASRYGRVTRRRVLGSVAAGTIALGLAPARSFAAASARVVVIGGGFAGTTAARELKRLDPGLDVTLIEAASSYVAGPMSNSVIAGLRDISTQSFGYDKIAAIGIRVVKGLATDIDNNARNVTLADGSAIPYDRLVIAPGIDFAWEKLPGSSPEAAEKMPHAYKPGAQTLLLKRQLDAMADGGVVVITAPDTPYRCPLAPYERASLIAHSLKTTKPRSKIIILDAKDIFPVQKLFLAAWESLYPGMIDWISLSQGGRVTEVDAGAMTISTDFETTKATVANVIPPQKAGKIAGIAGVADASGWCPIDPTTFESRIKSGIHVIGDAATTGALAKSAVSAHGEGKIVAGAIVAMLKGQPPGEARVDNACYSLIAPDFGLSVAGTYRPLDTLYGEVPGSGRFSPVEASAEVRSREAQQGEVWFAGLTHDVFG